MVAYTVFLLVCLAFYCPVFTLLAWVTPWKGFAVFNVKHRRRQYRAVHLALLDRVGNINRRRTLRYHRAFVCALECALSMSPSRPVFFRSHLMRPAQVKLAYRSLSGRSDYRYRLVSVKLPQWERVAMVVQMLLQEWRLIPFPSGQAVMVVIRPVRH